MYNITIKGETGETDYDGPLKDIDGLDCQDEFSEYFNDDEQDLIDKGVHSGYMSFIYEDGKLFTITKYLSDDHLTKAELNSLGEYTQGQWSDGIGEGFEQQEQYLNGQEFYVSPWKRGQVLTITQEEE